MDDARLAREVTAEVVLAQVELGAARFHERQAHRAAFRTATDVFEAWHVLSRDACEGACVHPSIDGHDMSDRQSIGPLRILFASHHSYIERSIDRSIGWINR